MIMEYSSANGIQMIYNKNTPNLLGMGGQALSLVNVNPSGANGQEIVFMGGGYSIGTNN